MFIPTTTLKGAPPLAISFTAPAGVVRGLQIMAQKGAQQKALAAQEPLPTAFETAVQHQRFLVLPTQQITQQQVQSGGILKMSDAERTTIRERQIERQTEMQKANAKAAAPCPLRLAA